MLPAAIAVGVAAAAAAQSDISGLLLAADGVVSVVEATSTVPGTRFYRIEIEQPVDHADRRGPSFRQRITVSGWTTIKARRRA